jgi:hypothetical protein
MTTPLRHSVRFVQVACGYDCRVGPRRVEPFKGWQWAEIAVVAVLIWAQIIVREVLDQLLIAGLLGLVLLGLLVHIVTWLIPLVRARQTGSGTSGALLGHGERRWVIVSGLCVLVLGIVMGCTAVLDLVARGDHERPPGSAGWTIAMIVLGLVLAVAGNLVVQFERIRVRRDAR